MAFVFVLGFLRWGGGEAEVGVLQEVKDEVNEPLYSHQQSNSVFIIKKGEITKLSYSLRRIRKQLFTVIPTQKHPHFSCSYSKKDH